MYVDTVLDPADLTTLGIRIGEQLSDWESTNEELDIQTAGFTKCRFPVLAKRYVVRDGKVLHADLSGLEPIGP